MGPRQPTYRYQLRAGSQLLRYLPIFAGVVLATAFSLSVLYDGLDVAEAAWGAGDELLGLFGGFGVVVLPIIFLLTGVLRRGRRRALQSIAIDAKTLVVQLLGGESIALLEERVRSGFSQPLGSGLVRVDLELGGGMTDGDQVVLELEPADAEQVMERLVGEARRSEFSSESWLLGAFSSNLAVLIGLVIGTSISARLFEVAARLPASALEASPGNGFTLGVTLAAIGASRAMLALLAATASVLVGVDGVRVEGFMRRRFVAYEDIVRLEHRRRGLVMVLRDGRSVTLARLLADRGRADAVAALILERKARAQPRGALAFQAESRQSLQSCRQALGRALDGVGYRKGALSAHVLEHELASPGLTSHERVATALMLLDLGERPERIRIAASALADDETRNALERIAEGDADDATLEAILLRRPKAF